MFSLYHELNRDNREEFLNVAVAWPYCYISMVPYSLALLNFWGVWPSVNQSSAWKQHLYTLYTIFIILFVYLNTLSQIIDLFISYKNLKSFINNAFILLSTIGAGVKAAHLVWRRQDIHNLMKRIQSYPCRPESPGEELIQQRFNRIIKYMTLSYASLFICTISALTTASFIRDVPRQQLYYRAWIPFDYSTSVRFWVIYLHQVIAHAFDASMHAAYDTLAPAMMIQACAQFEILNLRFNQLPTSQVENQQLNDTQVHRKIYSKEKEKIARCVNHHIQIFDFAQENNAVFGRSIFLQYSVSSLVLCMSVLRLSQMSHFSTDLISIFLYLISMIFQVFMPCYTGNQISIQSTQVCDAIYSMDWSVLSTNSQKSLVLIMSRTQRPVKFISGYIIPLSINSFNNVIKISYSIFNVIHRSSIV